MYVLLVRVFGAHEKKWLVLYLSLGWGETMTMYIVHLPTASMDSAYMHLMFLSGLPLIPLIVTIGVAFGVGSDYYVVTSDEKLM